MKKLVLLVALCLIVSLMMVSITVAQYAAVRGGLVKVLENVPPGSPAYEEILAISSTINPDLLFGEKEPNATEASNHILIDDFDDNSLSTTLWFAGTTGSGPFIAETNQRLELGFPANSSELPGKDGFVAIYWSSFQLRGDYDVEVEYSLLNWPLKSGTKVKLAQPYKTVERTGADHYFDENYLTNFDDGVKGVIPTDDVAGKLRLVRRGNLLTGYYFDHNINSWVEIHTGPGPQNEVGIQILIHSDDDYFGDQDVLVAFDNFIVNQGEVIYPTTGFDCDNRITVNFVECQALVALYLGTNGNNWTNNDNWLIDNNPCNWFGITCREDGYLEIRLPKNNLEGQLTPTMFNHTRVLALDLYDNQLTGNLNGINSMNQLRYLDVGRNRLSGPFPLAVTTFSELTYLNLGFNNFSGKIPAELGELKNLVYLNLIYNHFSESIPKELGQLTNLYSLGLSSNNLTGEIPAELGSLKELKELFLGSNRLTGPIPPDLGQLPNLELLFLAYNGLTGEIPGEIGDLAMLKSLLLNDNPLSRPLPQEFMNLENLSSFDFKNTDLCEPDNPAFQQWLAGVETVISSDFTCTVLKVYLDRVIFTVQEEGTTYDFPAGTFDEPSVLERYPLAVSIPSTGKLAGINHAYELSAQSEATGASVEPSGQYSVTIEYDDSEVAGVKEETLVLHYWDGSKWVEEPTSQLDASNNSISAIPDHFSIWAVLGETERIYLPIIEGLVD